MIEQLVAVGTTTAEWLWKVANTNFMIAFLSASTGAAAGAYGAQRIVERSERKRRMLEEIRSINASIMVAVGIVSIYCSVKRQHVRRLKKVFDEQLREVTARWEAVRKGGPPLQKIFEFQTDFETLLPPAAQIDVLQKQLYEKVSITGRPLASLGMLCQAAQSLEQALELRNSIIAHCKANSPMDQNVLIPIYFGLPDKNNHVDRNYPDSVEAISLYTDDCVFYAFILSEDLVKYGKSLTRAFGRGAPKIHELDWTKAKQADLIPADSLYGDWLAGFKPSIQTKRTWFRRR